MNNNRNKKIEEILNSLDGSKRTAMPEFFYTRLKARMEKGLEGTTKQSWVLRPAYAFIALVVVLLINAAVILKGNVAKENTGITDTETMQSIAAEYSLNDNSTILYDINQDK